MVGAKSNSKLPTNLHLSNKKKKILGIGLVLEKEDEKK